MENIESKIIKLYIGTKDSTDPIHSGQIILYENKVIKLEDTITNLTIEYNLNEKFGNFIIKEKNEITTKKIEGLQIMEFIDTHYFPREDLEQLFPILFSDFPDEEQ